MKTLVKFLVMWCLLATSSLSFSTTTKTTDIEKNFISKNFISAAQEGNLQNLKTLLPYVKNNAAFDLALHKATQHGFRSTVQYLLEVHEYTLKTLGKTLLECSRKGYVRIADLLLNAGADVNFRDVDAKSTATPLMEAAHAGHDDLVELLLNSDADTNIEIKGMTAYDLAVENGKTSTSKIPNLFPSQHSSFEHTRTILARLPWKMILATSGIILGAILLRQGFSYYLARQAEANLPDDAYEKCGICWEPLKKDVMQLPCSHSFHNTKDCFQQHYLSFWPLDMQTVIGDWVATPRYKQIERQLRMEKQTQNFEEAFSSQAKTIANSLEYFLFHEAYQITALGLGDRLYQHFTTHARCPQCMQHVLPQEQQDQSAVQAQ